MVGVIDEIRMPVTETERYPTLVDTKTRARAKLPTEAQQRNGRYYQVWFLVRLLRKIPANSIAS